MQFKDLQLNKHLLKAIVASNYELPTLIQEKAIPYILAKEDIIASAQTGTGKTAAFALPILQLLFDKQDTPKKGKKIKALIVSPTRELAQQIKESFDTYGKYTLLKSAVVYGGTSIELQKEILKKGVDILIATPGRLLDLYKQKILHLSPVEILVVDEADLMLDMGFIEDVLKIEKSCPDKKQTLLFSATMPNKVVQLANTILDHPKTIDVSSSSVVSKLVHQTLYYVPKPKKIELCLHLLRNTIKGNVLIFRRTKMGVDKLEKALVKNKFHVESIHGDKSQTARQDALKNFKKGEVRILIATDVAARGIDIKGMDAVLNFDLPNVPEIYVHRIGRAGRAGKEGISYAFCSADEKNYVASIEKLIHQNIFIETDHPYPLDPKAKPEVHKKQGSKYKKARKSKASKKKKKRWY